MLGIHAGGDGGLGDGGAMLLGIHGGDDGRIGDGGDIDPVVEYHQAWPGIPLQSNLRGSPRQLLDSSVDISGSGVCGKGWARLFWKVRNRCLLFARSPGDLLLLLARLIGLPGG